jgi:hypothetical protein
VHVVDPYELPVLFKTVRDETKIDEPSVIITNRPCVLIEEFKPFKPSRSSRRTSAPAAATASTSAARRSTSRAATGGEGLRQGSRPGLRAHRQRRLHRLRPVRAALRAGGDRAFRLAMPAMWSFPPVQNAAQA